MKFCPLFSGSSGNSIFVSTENSRVLVDAGLSGKNIEKALTYIGENPTDIDGIFITHEHIDHVKGVGVLSRRYDIPIYANEPTWNAMIKSIGQIKEKNIKIMDSKWVTIKDINICNYDIPHDAASPVGYVLCNNKKKACIATDLGVFSEDIKNYLKDADVILLESNHDIEMLKFGPYPYPLKRRILSNIGHLSNEACGNAISEIIGDNQKTIILGHLSKTNNYPELAYKTVVNILDEKGIKLDREVRIKMAERDMPSECIVV